MAKSKPTPRPYNGGYRVNFRYPADVRHRKRFPDRNYPDAHQAACDYIDAILGGRLADWEPLAKVTRLYLDWCERTGKKTYSTVRSDRQRLMVFAEWAGSCNIRSPRDVSVSHIRSFYAWYLDNFPLYRDHRRRWQSKLPAEELNRRRLVTWDKYRLALSALFNWCVGREYMDDNPLQGAKEFRPGKQQQALRFRVFSADELAALFGWFDLNRDHMIATFFRLLAYTGLRVGEALTLTWSSVDFAANRIHLQHQTKSRSMRSIPIKQELRPHLERLQIETKRRVGLVFSAPITKLDTGATRARNHDAWYKLLQTAVVGQFEICRRLNRGIIGFFYTENGDRLFIEAIVVGETRHPRG